MNAQKCTYTCNGETKSLRVNIQLKIYWKFHNVKPSFQLAEKEKKKTKKQNPTVSYPHQHLNCLAIFDPVTSHKTVGPSIRPLLHARGLKRPNASIGAFLKVLCSIGIEKC